MIYVTESTTSQYLTVGNRAARWVTTSHVFGLIQSGVQESRVLTDDEQTYQLICNELGADLIRTHQTPTDQDTVLVWCGAEWLQLGDDPEPSIPDELWETATS